jgi:hypothetical protein
MWVDEHGLNRSFPIKLSIFNKMALIFYFQAFTTFKIELNAFVQTPCLNLFSNNLPNAAPDIGQEHL